jgi:hypothetical protein
VFTIGDIAVSIRYLNHPALTVGREGAVVV